MYTMMKEWHCNDDITFPFYRYCDWRGIGADLSNAEISAPHPLRTNDTTLQPDMSRLENLKKLRFEIPLPNATTNFQWYRTTAGTLKKRGWHTASTVRIVESVGDPWHIGADPDPHLWLTDPDPTVFFSDFKSAKKLYFPHIFSSHNLPAGTLSSVFILLQL
jgi:hypothetical protein